MELRNVGNVILIAILLTGCGKKPTGSPAGTRIGFHPQIVTLGTGETRELTLEIENCEVPLFGLSMRLVYDSNVISVVDSALFSPGEFFGTEVVIFSVAEAEVLHLAVTLTQGQPSVQGSGSVGTVMFRGKAAGTCYLEILPDELIFYDSEGNRILVDNLETGSARFTVQ